MLSACVRVRARGDIASCVTVRYLVLDRWNKNECFPKIQIWATIRSKRYVNCFPRVLHTDYC